jgi:hypothetical protein
MFRTLSCKRCTAICSTGLRVKEKIAHRSVRVFFSFRKTTEEREEVERLSKRNEDVFRRKEVHYREQLSTMEERIQVRSFRPVLGRSAAVSCRP